jgi:hypothetical protein
VFAFFGELFLSMVDQIENQESLLIPIPLDVRAAPGIGLYRDFPAGMLGRAWGTVI